MKLMLSREEGIRPYILGMLALVLVGISSVLAAGASEQIVGSDVGRITLLFGRLGISLVPPIAWIGAVAIVILWLAVMVRVWWPSTT